MTNMNKLSKPKKIRQSDSPCQRKSKDTGIYVFVPNPNNNVAKKRAKEQNCKAKKQKQFSGVKVLNNEIELLGFCVGYGTRLASVLFQEKEAASRIMFFGFNPFL
ncbi:MAG: hypothetical protein ACLFQQ_07080 [Desulfococcaceae bacterium]